MHPKLNHHGLGLLEILVGASLSGILIYAMTHFAGIFSRQQLQAKDTASLEITRRILMSALDKPASWQNTIAKNAANAVTNLSCLQTSLTCSSTPKLRTCGFSYQSCPTVPSCATGFPPVAPCALGYPFALYDGQNNLVYDGTSAANGFTRNGVLCSTFDGVNGNDQCPFHLDLRWYPLCTGNCVSPQVEVVGTFSYKPQSSADNTNVITFNHQDYDFNAVLPPSPTPFMLGGLSYILWAAPFDTTNNPVGSWVLLTHPESVQFSAPRLPQKIMISYSASSIRLGSFAPPRTECNNAEITECYSAIFLDGVLLARGSNKALNGGNIRQVQENAYATVTTAGPHTVDVRHTGDGSVNSCAWWNQTLTVLRAN